MRRSADLVIGMSLLCVVAAVPPRGGSYAQQQNNVRALTEQERAIKVSITTGGGLFGPPKDQFRVGQRIPVSITMTNTSDEPVQVCVSGTLYQDRPKLLRDGQPVPYLNLQSEVLRTAEQAGTCLKLDLPEQIILQPDEARDVDWFILAEGSEPMGDISWYEPLQVGKYELSVQYSTSCCDGPMIESNKISFEVVP